MFKILSVVNLYAVSFTHPYGPFPYINEVCVRVNCQLIVVVKSFRYFSHLEIGCTVNYSYIFSVNPSIYPIGYLINCESHHIIA